MIRTIARVSRSTALRQAETKRLVTLNLNFAPLPLDAGYYKYYYKNIFQDVFNGTEQSDLIGSELVDPYFTWKWTVRFNIDVLRSLNSAGTGPQTVKWWMILVASNDQLPFGGTPQPQLYPLTIGNPGWFYQNDPDRMTFNGNNVKVLKKMVRQWHLPSIPAGASTSLPIGVEQFSGKMKYRFRKGKKKFEDSTPDSRSAYLRGWNYYLLGGWWVPNTLSATPLSAPITYLFDQYMYFKDP